MFNHGAFGGAPKRFAHLFLYLRKEFPDQFYFIINNHLREQLSEIFGAFNFSNVFTVDIAEPGVQEAPRKYTASSRFYADNIPDPLEVDAATSNLRKVFWYSKNYFRQRKLFRQIETLRKLYDIKVFIGVFGGVIPLMFFVDQKPRRASVIFSDMDSWFVDVHEDMKRLWYRKYYSFNLALEKADIVDFLSPYILEGVRARGIKIDDRRAVVAPCSFADYSKCRVGDKSKFEVAFAARLEPDKNPMIFLEAAKTIHSEFPETKFYLLGEGTLVHVIRDFINNNRLSNVIDFRFHNNPPDVFAQTSVFVTLQSNTNYPSQSVLEAMASGNAIIASDVGDTNLFINESNGILIDLQTSNLVTALKKLITTPELAVKMGKKGRETVLKDHKIEKMANYYLELIERACQKL